MWTKSKQQKRKEIERCIHLKTFDGKFAYAYTSSLRVILTCENSCGCVQFQGRCNWL